TLLFQTVPGANGRGRHYTANRVGRASPRPRVTTPNTQEKARRAVRNPAPQPRPRFARRSLVPARACWRQVEIESSATRPERLPIRLLLRKTRTAAFFPQAREGPLRPNFLPMCPPIASRLQLLARAAQEEQF